jgi:hypothetical protein
LEFYEVIAILKEILTNQYIMKKVLLFAVVLGGLSLVSCKKDYTCTTPSILGSDESEIKYTDLDKDEAEAAEAACTLIGGTWTTD